MKFKMQGFYMGSETFNKKDGSGSFTVAVFSQGVDTLKTFVSADLLPLIREIKPYSDVLLDMNINFNNDKTYVNLEKISSVSK